MDDQKFKELKTLLLMVLNNQKMILLGIANPGLDELNDRLIEMAEFIGDFISDQKAAL